MPDEIKVVVTEKKVEVYSPYHPDFPAEARKLAGKWMPKKGTWVFDKRDENVVRNLLRKIYGTDGSDTGEVVDVKITALVDFEEWRAAVFCAGRQVARAMGRDSGARLGNGVVMIDGKINSGGSAKNWHTYVKEGSIFELRDLPKLAVENIDTDLWDFEIARETIDRGALLIEKEKLETRLAEINELLTKAE